ncbi:hypothetical protein PNE29_11045, partial [Escherichia coli]|nr:hypothetical protein [Escherichia coli]MDB8078670.1 hypothetical protein [Escherichia coli]
LKETTCWVERTIQMVNYRLISLALTHVYIALYRSGNGVRQHLNGEPDALKGARPVRGGEAGK